MATLNFPSSPSNGAIHTHDGKQWQYVSADTKWIAYGASLAPDVLKVDAANNRVGINQTTPAYGLDVTGTARVTGVITASGGVTGLASSATTAAACTGNSATATTATTAGTVTTAAQSAITSVGTLTGLTLGGALTLADNLVNTATMKDYAETVYAGGNTSTAQTLALTNGNVQTWTMTGNCTFTMPSGSTLQAGSSFTLILTQDGTGSRTGAFTGVKWAGGTVPTLTITATTGIDILTFTTFNGGASPVWHGFLAGAAMA